MRVKPQIDAFIRYLLLLDQSYKYSRKPFESYSCNISISIIKISSMLAMSESNVQEGVNYVIPLSWWKKFKQYQSSSLISPDLSSSYANYDGMSRIDTYPIIDTLLVDFEQDIVNELSEKCNKLYIHQRFISSMISPTAELGQDYTIISSAYYNKLIKMHPVNHPILTFAFNSYNISEGERTDIVNGLICPRAHIQVQIIMCTNKTGHLFIGFFPQNADFLDLIRMIMRQLSFVQRKESKVIFLDQSPDVVIPLSKMPYKYTKDLNQHQKFIMITNLICQNEPLTMVVQNQQLNLSIESTKNNANMEHVLDRLFSEDHEIQRPDHKTISTGASTPLNFSINSDHRNEWEFHVMEMLRQKTQQEIEELRNVAEYCINGELVRVDYLTKIEGMKADLEQIGEELGEMASINRKKIKDKEY